MGDFEDLRLTETISLADRAAAIRNDLLPDVHEYIERAERGDYDEHTAADLRDFADTLEGQAKACDRVIEAAGGGDALFEIRELLTSEVALLQDDVTEESVDVDFERQSAEGTPKQGYHRIRTLQLSLIDAPDGLPTERDSDVGRAVYQVGILPDPVTQYLFSCVEALNDTGEVDGVGNLSDYGIRSDG